MSGQLRGPYKYHMYRQRNMGGSKCTKLIGLGDAAVSLCGGYFRTVSGNYAGFAGFWIADHCAWKGLAGGRFFLEDDADTRLAFHKPS